MARPLREEPFFAASLRKLWRAHGSVAGENKVVFNLENCGELMVLLPERTKLCLT